MSDGAALYVIAGGSADDPLDAVAQAAPLLTAYRDVASVGPGREVSMRAFRRSFSLDRDRLLYDLSGLGDLGWALAAAEETPGPMLLSHRAVLGPELVGAGRAVRRYAASAYRFPRSVLTARLGEGVIRPAPRLSPASPEQDFLVAVDAQAVEAGYQTLLGIAAGAREARFTIIAEATRDVRDLGAAARALGLAGGEAVALTRRGAIAELAARSAAVIDATEAGVATDAAAASDALGLPRLTGGAAKLSRTVARFAANPGPRRQAAADAFAAANPLEAFAEAIFRHIEEGRRHARRAAAAAA